jgi:hypothetical protein
VTFISRASVALAIAAALVLALAPTSAYLVLAETIAMDDVYTTNEDTQFDLADLENPRPNLLANDTNDGGTPCVASYDASGLIGTIDATAIVNGVFKYTPPPNWNGATIFTYGLGAFSGDGCVATPDVTATVTITVLPVNDAPSAVADSFSALKDRTLNVAAPGVLANDSDVDGDSLTAVKVNSPAHGVVTLASDGAFSYTPAAGYTGPDAFTYRASDGTASSPNRIVSISVSAIPPVNTPTPPPTVAPTPSPEPSPSESPLPSDSGLASPSAPADTGLASGSPAASPDAGSAVGESGPPLIAIGALGLLVLLLAVAAVYFVRSQRTGDEDGFETGPVEGEPDDEVDGG